MDHHSKPVLPRLNPVDRLYLVYLVVIAVLAALRGRLTVTLVVWHLAIAAIIVLLAANRCRSAIFRFAHDWYPLAMFIFTFEEIAQFSRVLVPHWQDFRVLAFEQKLFSGLPNLWCIQFASRPLSEFMNMGYFSYYPLFPVIAGALYAREDKKPFHELVLTSVLMYLISFTTYLVFPTEGPRKALPGFCAPPAGWFFSFLVRIIQGGAGVHGNALPSSHVALATLCGLASFRHVRKLFPFIALSICLICMSAVYDGYHYASDVLSGILVALLSAGLLKAGIWLRRSVLPATAC